MRFDLKKVTLLAAWTVLAEGGAYPQDAIHKLQPLVETSARRLAIGEEVALAKWDSGVPVRMRLGTTTSLLVLLKRPSREAWTQHRYQTSSEHRSKRTSSFSIHCWQSGAG